MPPTISTITQTKVNTRHEEVQGVKLRHST